MDISAAKLVVGKLNFLLLNRSVHPELFNIYARQKLITEKYEIVIWVTGCSHVASIYTDKTTLVEMITLPGQMLPQEGLLERFEFRGEKKRRFSLSNSLSYVASLRTEKMSKALYRRSHIDLERFARNRGMFVRFPKLAVSGLEPFTYIDFEARRDELHIHTLHAYPDQQTIIKVKSRIGF